MPRRFIYSNYNVICTNVNYWHEICNLHNVIIGLSTRHQSPNDDSSAVLEQIYGEDTERGAQRIGFRDGSAGDNKQTLAV